ncbi:MAG TPA: hypothetical protein VF533_13110 [Solirubrobacteraceae bacterium]|jgi:hypothetical protein
MQTEAVDRPSSLPSIADLAEQSILLVGGAVMGATICPGSLLCVPAIMLAVIPVALLGLVAAAAALVVLAASAPLVLGWRLARRLGHAPAPRELAGELRVQSMT